MSNYRVKIVRKPVLLLGENDVFYLSSSCSGTRVLGVSEQELNLNNLLLFSYLRGGVPVVDDELPL